MSVFPGLYLLLLGFLWLSGWLFPHPPGALYKGLQSNFTPGHPCQLSCQLHFFLETSLLELFILWPHPISTLPRPTTQLSSGTSLCCCSVQEPYNRDPCLQFSWFTPLFWWSISSDIFPIKGILEGNFQYVTYLKIRIINRLYWIDSLAVYKIQESR